jgi:hypothetical protein
MSTLEEIADELYALPPEEFTAARDERVRELRAGDRALSEAVKALRRPSLPAWLVGLLARERRVELEDLLSLGEALRAAQEALSGDELRQLGEQRRAVVGALVRTAAALGRDRGLRVTSDAEMEVAATLEAALADPAAADAVRSGRLATALGYAGFGPGDPGTAVPSGAGSRRATPDLRVAPPADTAGDGGSGGRKSGTKSGSQPRGRVGTPGRDDAAATERRREEAERAEEARREAERAARLREIAVAEEAAHTSAGAADDAQEEYERRQRSHDEAHRAVERAREAVEAARRRLEDAGGELAAAERRQREELSAAAAAERAARAAHAAAERARTRLDRLRRS